MTFSLHFSTTCRSSNVPAVCIVHMYRYRMNESLSGTIPVPYVWDVLRLASAIFVCSRRTAPSWIRLATLVRSMYGTVASDCNSASTAGR